MFNNSKNIMFSGGTFNVSTSVWGKKGIDYLQEGITPGAFHNSAERYDPPKCHPRTRLAVLEAIMAWVEDGQKTTFIKWLYGPAGAGKSAIAQTIAEMCHQLGILAASFFWSRSAPGRNDEQRLIASLAYQLILSIPKMRIHVEQALEDDPSLLSRSLQAQMESLIIEPLEKTFPRSDLKGYVDSVTTKLIILDGLDECGTPEAQRYILKVISTAVQRFPIPLVFLIASRPEHEIRASFNSIPLLSMTARLALDDSYHPDDDIRLFLVESFDSLKATHTLGSLLSPNWPTAEEVGRLVQKSSGQFIYAATVVKFIRTPRGRPDEQLNVILGIADVKHRTPFAELDALYLHIFDSVEDLSRVLDIISCVFVFAPLTYFNSYHITPYNIENILSYHRGDFFLTVIDLHSILDIPDIEDPRGELRVFHASLQDFLRDPSRSRHCHLDEGRAHARVVRGCLHYIRNFSEPDKGNFKFNELVFGHLCRLCTKSSPTKELLADLFEFDFEQWVSTLLSLFGRVVPLPDDYFHGAFCLYRWFGTQELHVQEYFGPGMSLSAHHSRGWGTARDILFQHIILGKIKPRGHPNVFTAATHPQIVQDYDENFTPIKLVLDSETFFLDFPFDYENSTFWEDVYSEGEAAEVVLELQKFLRDPERSKSLFIHDGMYAALSLHILKFISEPARQEEYRLRLSQIWQLSADCLTKALRWATKSLPFYLSQAGYTSELTDYLRNYNFNWEVFLQSESVDWDIQPLHDEIDQYLKKSLRMAEEHKNLNPESIDLTSFFVYPNPFYPMVSLSSLGGILKSKSPNIRDALIDLVESLSG